MASATLKDYALNYFFPLYLYGLFLYHFLLVSLRTLTHSPLALLSPSKLTDQSFGAAWSALDEGDPYDGPLQHILPTLSTVSGTVLEIGPGSGDQARFFTNENLNMVYGVEPCSILHEPLGQAVQQAGLGSRYNILGCGAERESLREGLTGAGLLGLRKVGKGSGGDGEKGEIFDAIIVIRVLCSVNNPVDTIDHLYKLLKPGGRLIVGEHIQNRWRKGTGSIFGRFTQVLYQFAGWSFLLGNCHLNRKTDEYLLDVGEKYGGWGKMEIKYVGEFAPIPFVVGELVKRG